MAGENQIIINVVENDKDIQLGVSTKEEQQNESRCIRSKVF